MSHIEEQKKPTLTDEAALLQEIASKQSMIDREISFLRDTIIKQVSVSAELQDQQKKNLDSIKSLKEEYTKILYDFIKTHFNAVQKDNSIINPLGSLVKKEEH
jgi:hypothetical protein